MKYDYESLYGLMCFFLQGTDMVHIKHNDPNYTRMMVLSTDNLILWLTELFHRKHNIGFEKLTKPRNNQLQQCKGVFVAPKSCMTMELDKLIF